MKNRNDENYDIRDMFYDECKKHGKSSYEEIMTAVLLLIEGYFKGFKTLFIIVSCILITFLAGIYFKL